ncbi:MAG: hypothetical protein LUF85_06340 [Bacteroides sp.]|nr:hypothetical protein [Bacteroides sp.]
MKTKAAVIYPDNGLPQSVGRYTGTNPTKRESDTGSSKRRRYAQLFFESHGEENL